MVVLYQNIPEILKEYNHWVIWRKQNRNGHQVKIPYISTTCYPKRNTPYYAKVSDNTTWSSYQNTRKYSDLSGNDGIGFVFSNDDPFVGIDIDNCIIDGKIIPEIYNLIQKINSYTEISPSGNGIHIIIINSFLGNKRVPPYEIFGNRKYLTITGNVLENFRKITENKDIISELLVDKTKIINVEEWDDLKIYYDSIPESQPEEYDTDFIEYAIFKNDKIFKLFQGDCSNYGDDHSRADIALICFIANFSRNYEQIDEIFRRSKLMRPKWDEHRFMSEGINFTYGKCTIIKAIQKTSDYKAIRNKMRLDNLLFEYHTNTTPL